MKNIDTKPIKLMQRSPAERVLLLLSALAFICISPFIFFRLVNGDWQIAIVDTVISLVMLGFFGYVYITREVGKARLAMSLSFMSAILVGIWLKGPDLLLWIYPAMIVLYYLNSKKVALIISSSSIMILAILLTSKGNTEELATIIVTIVLTNMFSFIIFNSYHKINKKLEGLATTDELTSTLNRRALMPNLLALLSEQSRHESPMCLLLLDLDKFKNINDTYGHIIGDETLVTVSQIISNQIRNHELLYRYGGEEFLIAPIKQDLASAQKIAHRLRALIEKSPLPSGIQVTISIGVAQYHQGQTLEQWISRADSALYKAKKTGRNKVCIADANVDG